MQSAPQFDLFKTPYFLKLLCDQLTVAGELPKGRASLFTGFVRQALARELNDALFQPSVLFTEADHLKLNAGRWRDAFELPERGALLPRLSALAFAMQEAGQERLDVDAAYERLAHPQAADIAKAGLALNVLDKDLAQDELTFFHQLLREYFAARQLAKTPNATLVQVEWRSDRVSPSLAETVVGLADGDPLPPLAQTGWEETTLTAAAMARDREAFIRALIETNLPLAGRCAAAPEVVVSDNLKNELCDLLRERSQDFKHADLRARIAAAESLGTLGDARFALHNGAHGEYLLPPLVSIAGGNYSIGLKKSDYERETPTFQTELAAFEIGQFPVTNAEYAKFIAAKGYENEAWWDTDEARAWLRGEASTEGIKQQQRDNRITVQGWGEDYLWDLVKQERWTTQEVEDWLERCAMTEEEFDEQLDEWYPAGTRYREPSQWSDARFNHPSQPVVGVSWFEARAYCNWLTANVDDGRVFRLPTEFEFEAAARGTAGRLFPYEGKFDPARCNTFESHLRRTTPVGVFDNATPELAFDLTGNAYTWTLSIFDQEKFSYRQRRAVGREDVHATNVKRVLRGGSFFDDVDFARSVFRDDIHPAARNLDFGFRVVLVRPPS